VTSLIFFVAALYLLPANVPKIAEKTELPMFQDAALSAYLQVKSCIERLSDAG
jgi:hypothetical protein